MPRVDAFGPVASPHLVEPVTMSVDEYEIIRLMDWEGLDQDESADQMDVARFTVQRIYESARKKLADFLVNGKPLRLCESAETGGCCFHGSCWCSRDNDELDGKNEDKP